MMHRSNSARLKPFVFALFLMLLQFAGLSQSHADEYDIYLFAGQSNMDGRGVSADLQPAQLQGFENAIIYYRNIAVSSEGWHPLAPGFSRPPKYRGPLPAPTFGPEIGFVQTINQTRPDRKVAVIKGSKGGTNLRKDWVPGEKDDPESQGPCYKCFVETIQLATEELAADGHTFQIRGLLWHQGESDSKATTKVHQRRMLKLFERVREDVGVEDLPVVVGELIDTEKRAKTQAAIRAVGNSGPRFGLVTSADTNSSDGTHFDAPSQLLLGKRYATALVEIGDSPAGETKAAPKAGGTVLPAPKTAAAPMIDKPNILFISVDDLNDWIGCAGGNPDARTPNIDRFAERSIFFDNAHCQVALCNASRQSVMTGMYASTTGIYANKSKNATEAYNSATHMSSFFRENGYHVSCMGKIYHNDHGKRSLWDEIGPKTLRWGPEPPEGRPFKKRFGKKTQDSMAWAALDIEVGEMPDEQIATWGKQQLDKHKPGEPFFLALGFYKPHVPMTAPKRYFDLFDREKLTMPLVLENDLDDVPQIGRDWVLKRNEIIADDAIDMYSPTYRRELVHAYHACVALVDDCVGQVLDHLENSPHANNTIVVLWSDHGWHLGEKQHWRKWMPWEESTRSPLLIYVPGGAGNGQVCHRTVGLIDMYPTLAELCELKAPKQLEGLSFTKLLEDPTGSWERPALTSTKKGNHTVRSQNWRYIRYIDGSEELYDHTNDPNEWKNLAGLEKYDSIKQEHAAWIDKLTEGELLKKKKKK